MPAALKVDWASIKALYVAGATPLEIADEVGIDRNTIYKRAQRNKWDEVRAQAKRLVQSDPRANKEVSPSVQSAVNILLSHKEKFLSSGAYLASKTMEAGAKAAETISDHAQLADIALLMKPALDIAKPVFSLNDGQQVQVGVQVNMAQEIEAMPDFELPK